MWAAYSTNGTTWRDVQIARPTPFGSALFPAFGSRNPGASVTLGFSQNVAGFTGLPGQGQYPLKAWDAL